MHSSRWDAIEPHNGVRLVRQDRARRSRCGRRLSALAQAAENGIVTGTRLSIASVDEKGRDAYYRRSHGAMLSLFYEWGNRAAWIAAAIIAVLFSTPLITRFRTPGKSRCSSSAMQSNAKIGPSVKSAEGRSGSANTPYLQRTWRTSGQ